ncbi:energy-coupling factor transporter ATP-binding protein EcfA2 [Bradyrhizobium sp. USDA 4532]|uniref:TrlF family AAA-like ATPase n=1 Tax=unclassified Bradyrhizobium TaxID=2631580 RepID=UPI00209DD011|nr:MULTISPECIES: AAA family ATPase [unclassified Bradyrhizobium]MCP1835445.1 energy-coupling factor transporter ATP-binding protein EcfA2 [Bradyrhizobium sp. USDA 4545]MCP1920191.1 energy-coupling factor transporter ATP-binding protein EcfA2 [Bradyrhizobium sp. USDA 4532]
MAHEVGLHPGTTWHKCDFQCHTPRDLNWVGSPGLPGGNEAGELARQQWADSFIDAAEAAKLQAIAVSDHHDICLSAYVLQAAERRGSTVRVFPAVEITCSDNAQCIVVFDPAMSVDTQKLALAAAGNILAAPAAQAKTCAIVPARETVAGFVQAVQGEQHLRDTSVILPHFSKEEDHKTLNETGHHPRFANLPIDGVYIERPYRSLDATTLEKVRGKIADWGSRRRAILATGDNRNADWSRLGVHDCWIKLGEHSIEAFRQALLADEARIVFDAPTSPTEYLVELRVKSSLTGPAPVKISFNEGFNAFIGGRGSGKSAFLEYLRFGLGRTDKDFDNKIDPEFDREAKLISETLADDGYVEVVLEREGVRETWRRILSNSEMITVSAAGRTIEVTTRIARERFRGRAFRQKGLSSTMNNPATASEQITGIAAAEEVDRERDVKRAIENAQRSVGTALINLAALWQSRVDLRQTTEKVEDLRQRIAALTKRLEEEGLSPEALKTIEDGPKYGRANDYIRTVGDQARDAKVELERLESATLTVELSAYEGASDFDEAASLQRALSDAKAAIKLSFEAAKAALDVLSTKQREAGDRFEVKRAAFGTTYAAAVEEQGKHSNLIDEVARLNGELQTAEAAQARARSAELAKANAEKDYKDAIAQLDRLVSQRRDILKSAADAVAGKSSNMLKARARRDRLPAQYLAALQKLFEASHTQSVEESCTEWVSATLAADEVEGWVKLRQQFVGLYEAKIMAGSPPDASDGILSSLQTILFNGERQLTERQRKRIYLNLTDTTIAGIVAAVPADSIIMSYVDDGKAIDFKMASPGQQASALLELLLKQSAGTLIIDQPEDDLDNRVIMRIVELLRTSKSTRQLIFTTHNANIVVNGDADKIIALKSPEPSSNPNNSSPRVQLDCDGAIETPAVSATITSIMEGGREAFDLRSRKYRFDLQA